MPNESRFPGRLSAINRGELPDRRNPWLSAAVNILFILFVLCCLRYQSYLLHYMEWGDESETIVTSKMMASGLRLYAEIFNQHGPLTFLPGLMIEKLGDFDVSVHRLPIAALQVLAILALYGSPFLNTRTGRILVSVVSATFVLLYLPVVFGHMYKYQAIAGLLLVPVLALYTLPAIARRGPLPPTIVIGGNAIIAALPFLAITYLPIAAALFLASLRRQHLRPALAGALAATLANILFLELYGSFAGYVAYHLYLNSSVLPAYSEFQTPLQLLLKCFRTATGDLKHLLLVGMVLISATIIARAEGRRPWRTLLVVGGLLTLLMRGGGFHGMPFVYGVLAFLPPVLTLMESGLEETPLFSLTVLMTCTLRASLIIPSDLQELTLNTIPSQTEFSRFAQAFTREDDRIIAYSFQNYQYLAAHRLPASGHFFYLPWQAKYNEHPKFGMLIDVCAQIRAARPKVMLIEKWKVWGKYTWESYAGCVQDILDQDYRQIPGKSFYVRKDLIHGLDEASPRQLALSAPLTPNQPIPLTLPPALVQERPQSGMVEIGVRLRTEGRTLSGPATLELERDDGTTYSTEFPPQALADNEYRVFPVPPAHYVRGRISTRDGGGLFTWESQGSTGKSLTCMNFLYADGSRGFTPGCPLF